MKHTLASRVKLATAIVSLVVPQFSTANECTPLYFPFDGSTQGVAGDQPVFPSVSGLVNYADGKFGKSLRVGSIYAHLTVKNQSWINAQAGTVEFWIQPLDWQASDGSFHVFFDARGKNGGKLVLYKYFESNQLLGLTDNPDISAKNSVLAKSINWPLNSWHHLAMTWSPQGLSLYVDGQPTFTHPMKSIAPRELAESFVVGDEAWGRPRLSSSLMDDLTIYPCARSAADIAADFNQQPPEEDSIKPAPRRENTNIQPDKIPAQVTTSQDAIKQDSAPPINSLNSPGAGNTIAQARAIKPFETLLLRSNRSTVTIAPLTGLSTILAADKTPLVQKTSIFIKRKQAEYTFTAKAPGQLAQNANASWINHRLSSPLGIDITVTSKLEKEGEYHTSLSIAGGTLTAEDEIRLEFELNPKLFQYFHQWTEAGIDAFIPLENKQNIKLAYSPFFWLGNDLQGLFWFCGSSRNWPNAEAPDAIQLLRTNNQLRLIINLKKSGQSLPIGAAVNYSLLPTGATTANKPTVERLRMAPGKNANLAVIWPEVYKQEFLHYGFPQAANTNNLKTQVANLRTKTQAVAPYITPTFVSTSWSEWPAQSDSLWMGSYDATSADVVSWKAPIAMVYPTDNWTKTFTQNTRNFIKSIGANAIYVDNAKIYGSDYEPIGLGFQRAGKRHSEFPLLQYTKLYSQLKSAADSGAPSLKIMHASGQNNPFVYRYADYFVSGEQYRGKIQGSYLSLVPLSTWRTEFSAVHWGAKPIVIPEFNSADAQATAPTRELMGLVLLHNIAIWPILCNTNLVDTIYSAFDTAVRPGALFEGYMTQQKLSAKDNRFKISVYRNIAGKSVAVAFNAGEPAITRLCMQATTNSTVKNIEQNKFLKLTNGCVDLALSRGDFTLLELSE